MIEFPKKSAQIRGVRIGQSGAFANGVVRTEMELGAVKVRVRDSRPMYVTNVVVICTDIGRLQILEFYLGEARQGSKFFTWGGLGGFADDEMMRFVGEIGNAQKLANGVGLWELSFKLEVRALPTSPDAALIAEIELAMGSIGNLYASSNAVQNISIAPQLAAWGAL